MAVSLTFTPAGEITYRSAEIHFESAELLGALVGDLCQQLDNAGCRFEVEACGIEWSTSVDWDLGTILHWVPTVIDDLRNGDYTELHFFEQGMERKLLLRQAADGVTQAQAISVTDKPATIEGAVIETIRTDDLIRMLTALCTGTATTIQEINPGLAALDPLPLWRRGDPGPPTRRKRRPTPPEYI